MCPTSATLSFSLSLLLLLLHSFVLSCTNHCAKILFLTRSIPNKKIAADVELKKLVYLYLMNYAKTNPDLAILAVNTFVKDAADRNPLIRALAVRTMGCIRVDRIVE